MAITFDSIIIGSGLVGLLTAKELHVAGQTVALFDRGTPGMESSWAGGGILSPLYPWRSPAVLRELVRWGQKTYPELAAALKRDTGIDPEWQQSGMLILEDQETAAVGWSRKNDVRCEMLTAEETAAIEPALQQAGDKAIWLPEVAQIKNPLLIRALIKDLQQRGVGIYHPVNVNRLVVQHDTVQCIETATDRISAGNYIVSAGAWSNQLVSGFDYELPVKPVRGQMLCVRADKGYLQRILLRKGFYIIPRIDGHILVGSTLEDVGFDKRTDARARDKLLQQAARLLPDIGDLPLVKHWSGLRPGTPDGIPYICAYPGINNLYLNTGHYRSGITLAPASARLLADIILSRQTLVPAKPFSVLSHTVTA